MFIAMRPRTRLAAILTGSVFWSLTCGQPHNTFDVSQPAQGTVTPGHSTSTIDFAGFDDYGSTLAANATVKQQGALPTGFLSVKPVSVTIRVVSPVAGQDLSFIRQIGFSVQADGLPKLPFASASLIAAGLNLASLDLQNVELVKYFQAQNLRIVVDTTLGSLNQSVTLQAEPTFQIELQQFPGACLGSG